MIEHELAEHYGYFTAEMEIPSGEMEPGEGATPRPWFILCLRQAGVPTATQNQMRIWGNLRVVNLEVAHGCIDFRLVR